MVANWASSAAVNLEQRKVSEKTTSTSLLPLPLNDVNINSSRSNVDEKYVIQVKKQAVVGEDDKILLYSIFLAYHCVKNNKDFRSIGLGYEACISYTVSVVIMANFGEVFHDLSRILLQSGIVHSGFL